MTQIPFQPIKPISNIALPFLKNIQSAPSVETGETFQGFLAKALAKVNTDITTPNDGLTKIATGQEYNFHRISIEQAKADVLVKMVTKAITTLSGGVKTLFSIQM